MTQIPGHMKFSRVARLLDNLTLIEDDKDVEALLDRLPQAKDTLVISFLNTHAVNLAWRDKQFYKLLLSSDLLFRDGAGIFLLFKMLGKNPGLNLNGTDLIPRIASRFSGKNIALMGSANPYLEEAGEHVKETGAKVTCSVDGYKNVDHYFQALRQDVPDLIILGMGMPKQEKVANHLALKLNKPCVLVNGGAIIDFWSARFPRAPRLMRALGLEWLFRLMLEPRRLWRRYLLGNTIFLLRAAIFVCLKRMQLHI